MKNNKKIAMMLTGCMMLSLSSFESLAATPTKRMASKSFYPGTGNITIDVGAGTFNKTSFNNIANRWNRKSNKINIVAGKGKDSIPLYEGSYKDSFMGVYIARCNAITKKFSGATIKINSRTITQHYNNSKSRHSSKKELTYHVLAHELGHALGLEDYPPQGYKTIMRYGCESENLGGPTESDIEGVLIAIGAKSDKDTGATTKPGTTSTNTSYKPNAQVSVSGRLNIRSGPGTNYGVKGYIENNGRVQIISEKSGWSYIRFGDGRFFGYAKSDYLVKDGSKTTTTSTTSNATVTTNGGKLNVRSGPSINYEVKGSLNKGTKVQVLSEGNGWSKIRYSSNKTGYVSSQYLTKVNSKNAQAYSEIEDYDIDAKEDMLMPTSMKNKFNNPLNSIKRDIEDKVVAPEVPIGKELLYTLVEVPLKTKPSNDSEELLVIPEETEIEVLGEEGEWFKVSYNGKVGYVMSKLFQFEQSINFSYPSAESKEEIIESSDEIVNGILRAGELVRMNVGTEEEPINIEYYVADVEVKRVLKGNVKENEIIKVKFPVAYLIDKAEELNLAGGSEVALFLMGYEDGVPYSSYNMSQAIINFDAKSEVPQFHTDEANGEHELFDVKSKEDLFAEIERIVEK